MTDIFDEVEEEVRKERWEQLWKKYGNYALAGGVIVVLTVGGYRGWQAYQKQQNEQASDQYLAAQQLAASGNLVAAEAAFGKLSVEAPSGYARLAKFAQAAVMLTEGKREAAIAAMREIAEDDGEPVLASMARIQIAWAEADTASKDVIQKTLAPLLVTNGPYNAAALEIVAYVALRTGARDEAIAAYSKLGDDAKAPNGIKQRSAAIAAYLKANPDIATLPTAMAPPTLAPAPAPAAPAPTSAAPAPTSTAPSPAPVQEPHPQ